MRTTLDLDDDIRLAARELAALEGKTIGQKISELARAGLTVRQERVAPAKAARRNGVPVLAPSPGVVSLEVVNLLRDEELQGG